MFVYGVHCWICVILTWILILFIVFFNISMYRFGGGGGGNENCPFHVHFHCDNQISCFMILPYMNWNERIRGEMTILKHLGSKSNQRVIRYSLIDMLILEWTSNEICTRWFWNYNYTTRIANKNISSDVAPMSRIRRSVIFVVLQSCPYFCPCLDLLSLKPLHTFNLVHNRFMLKTKGRSNYYNRGLCSTNFFAKVFSFHP